MKKIWSVVRIIVLIALALCVGKLLYEIIYGIATGGRFENSLSLTMVVIATASGFLIGGILAEKIHNSRWKYALFGAAILFSIFFSFTFSGNAIIIIFPFIAFLTGAWGNLYTHFNTWGLVGLLIYFVVWSWMLFFFSFFFK